MRLAPTELESEMASWNESSSYAYAGIDSPTKRLAHELESLGGGDATLGSFEVHAVIDDHMDENKGRSGIQTHLSQILVPALQLLTNTP